MVLSSQEGSSLRTIPPGKRERPIMGPHQTINTRQGRDSFHGLVVEPGPRRRPAEPQIVGSNPTQPATLTVKIKGPRNEGDPFLAESVLPTLGRERMSSGKGAGILAALIFLIDSY